MRMVVVLAPLALVLAGCVTVTDKLAEPGPGAGKPTPKKQTLIVTDADEGKNQGKGCELKNPAGTGTCDDGRQAVAGAKASARTDRPFVISDCADGNYFEDMRKLAELGHRKKEWLAYCRAWEDALAAPAPAAKKAAVTDGGDRGGTWYCDDKVDGAGNYGTWEMTQMTDRYYNCYRAD